MIEERKEDLSTADTDPTLLARKDALIWKARAEAAEAQRDRLAAKVAEVELERNAAESTKRSDNAYLLARLQQATELLRRWLNPADPPHEAEVEADTTAFLAALAGEDEKPPDPQREGDYL